MFNIFKRTPIEQKIEFPKGLQEVSMARTIAYNFTDPYVSEMKNSLGYIFGTDNLYPQELLKLYSTSPIHSASLNYKRLLTAGNGVSSDINNLQVKDQVVASQLLSFFNKNIEKISADYFIHGRFYLEITWNSDFTKIIKVKSIGSEKIRYSDLNGSMEPVIYNYCWDWKQYTRFGIKKYPVFDLSNKKDNIQLFEYQCETPGRKLYTLPDYRSCLDWVNLDSEMGVYHKANITNSLNPSLLVKIYNNPESKEKKDAIRDGLNDSFSGAANTGRALVLFSSDKDSCPDVTQMEPNKLDESFLKLTDTIQRQILYAHNINPDLLGLKTPGSLGGNAGQLETIQKQFNFACILPAKRNIECVLNEIASYNGIYSHYTLPDVII